MIYGVNYFVSVGIDIGASLGATTFYNAGYAGGNARVANIEGGTPWRGHETLDWILAANIFSPGLALSESTTPVSTTQHATGVTQVMVGKAPAGSTFAEAQKGIAYGVPATQFFAGNIASTIDTSTGSFNFEVADMRAAYTTALITGVNGNPANRVDVVNSSYGGDTTSGNLDGLAKVLDSVVFAANATRGSTMVIAAGNSGPGANTLGSPASGYNALVVAALGELSSDPQRLITYNSVAAFSSRGPAVYFQPSLATDEVGTATALGRARVDIAAPGVNNLLAYYDGTPPASTLYSIGSGTSFASPTVAGGVALLADYARSPQGLADPTFATDGRVIKAVLINSADKTSGWNNGQTWNGTTWNTTQGLDYAAGGGRMNLDQAYRQYANTATNTVTQLINPTETGPITVTSTGWARATLDRPNASTSANVDFVISGTLSKYTELNTTLSWFVNRISDVSGNAAEIGFHNLNLEVWRTDASGNPVTLVGSSASHANNTEHLSFLIPQDGTYLVRVTRPSGTAGTYYSFAGDTTSDVFGLAWMSRPGLVATSGANTNIGGTDTRANVLIAPDLGQSASLTLFAQQMTVLNRVFVGGNDLGAGGTGSLSLISSVFTVNNAMRVYPGASLSVADSGIGYGILTLDPGSSFTVSGSSLLQFSQINTSVPLVVPSGSSTFYTFMDTTGANVGRYNLLSAVATFEVAGTVSMEPLIAGAFDLVKNGVGTLVLSPGFGGANLYTGTTQVTAGTLQLGSGGGIPVNGNIIVASGGTFDLNAQSNTNTTAIGRITLNGGLLTNTGGTSEYYANQVVTTGGTINFSVATDFALHLLGSGATISTNASASTTTWTASGTTRLLNDTTAALPIQVAPGTTPSGIDLDFGAILSRAGTSTSFAKTGSGTLRITNAGNTADLQLLAGRVRVDDFAALGSGSITLNGGTLSYAGATASSSKWLTIASNGGALEVTSPGSLLTLTNEIAFGAFAFTKLGSGTLNLTGTNTGTPAAVAIVNAGILQVGVSGGLPEGSRVNVNSGGTLHLSASPVANVRVFAGGTVAGTSGLAAGSELTIDGILAPGAPGAGNRGSLSVGGNVAFNAGGRYNWDVSHVPSAGGAGLDWDFLTATGSLNGTASSTTRFEVVVSAAGPVNGFSNQTSYAWTIAHFDGAVSLIDTSFFVTPQNWTGSNDLGGGSFSLLVSGQDLQVSFTPVPEPTTALTFAALGLAFLHRRSRRHFQQRWANLRGAKVPCRHAEGWTRPA